MMHTLAIATIVLALAPDGARRVLLGADLSRQTVTIERMDGESIGVVDSRGVRRSVATSDVLAVFAEVPPRRLALEGSRSVGLTDGQVLVGTLGVVDGDEESLLVRHPVLGEMRLPLDAVLWITGLDAPPQPPMMGNDSIVLANGDLLTGFVAGFASGSDLAVTIEMESSAGARQKLGLESVLAVVIANNATPPAGARAWLADGTSVAVREFAMSDGARSGIVRVTPKLLSAREGRVTPTEDESAGSMTPAPDGSLVLEHVVGWMPEAGRLVALADLRVRSVEPVAPRPWTEGPTMGEVATSSLGAPDVHLPGPARIEWELPPGADGFSCVVTLPEAYRDWGDCEVVIATAGSTGPLVERWRGHVNAERPTAAVGLEFLDKPARLLVTVEPGAFGPIQDRPTLETPLVRIARPGTD